MYTSSFFLYPILPPIYLPPSWHTYSCFLPYTFFRLHHIHLPYSSSHTPSSQSSHISPCLVPHLLVACFHPSASICPHFYSSSHQLSFCSAISPPRFSVLSTLLFSHSSGKPVAVSCTFKCYIMGFFWKLHTSCSTNDVEPYTFVVLISADPNTCHPPIALGLNGHFEEEPELCLAHLCMCYYYESTQ